jgi:segregation and condensation protein A
MMKTMIKTGRSHPTVEVEGFSGPFDLLVRLIERRELNVLTISLAEVTEQYLDHLAALRLRDPEHLSAFLVVAAKLLLIKSSLLLPSPPRQSSNDEALPDPTDLTERLREYQKFRRAGQWLATREDEGLRSYARPPVPYQPTRPTSPEPLDPVLLRDAWLRALNRPRAELEPVAQDTEKRLTVAEALAMLQSALSQFTTLRFGDLVGPDTPRQYYVAIFLAILEAVRQGLVSATQDEPFGEISLTRLQA